MAHPLILRLVEITVRTLFGSLGVLFSPGWWVYRQTLERYLDLNALLTTDGLSTYSLVCLQLKLLGKHTLVYEVMPAILLCLLVSIGSLLLWGKTGQWLAHQLIKRIPQPVPVPH